MHNNMRKILTADGIPGMSHVVALNGADRVFENRISISELLPPEMVPAEGMRCA